MHSGGFPLRPLTRRQIPIETVKAIKEGLYDDSSRKNMDALAIKHGVGGSFVRQLKIGDIHASVEPILKTQK